MNKRRKVMATFNTRNDLRDELDTIKIQGL